MTPARKLRAPNPDAWQQAAACRGMSLDLFFDGPGRERGKEVCATCPVQTQCLDFALVNGCREGTWGGLGPRQRTKIARQRQAAA